MSIFAVSPSTTSVTNDDDALLVGAITQFRRKRQTIFGTSAILLILIAAGPCVGTVFSSGNLSIALSPLPSQLTSTSSEVTQPIENTSNTVSTTSASTATIETIECSDREIDGSTTNGLFVSLEQGESSGSSTCSAIITGTQRSRGKWFQMSGVGDIDNDSNSNDNNNNKSVSTNTCVTLSTCHANTSFDSRIRVFLLLESDDREKIGSSSNTTSSSSNNNNLTPLDLINEQKTNKTCIAGNDDANELCPKKPHASTITFKLTPNEQHYILVDGVDNEVGDFILRVNCEPCNDNDNESTSFPITAPSVSLPSPATTSAPNSIDAVITSNPSATGSIDPSIIRSSAIISQLRSLSGDAVEQAGTPQKQAADFIIYKDQLQVDATSSYLKQRYVLALLYYSLNGPSWKDQTNMLSGQSECEWAGTTCLSSIRPYIRSIVWYNNNMSGKIPEEIGVFENLEILNFGYNMLDGQIPTTVWTNLTKLQILRLGDNLLTGTIPSNVSNLVYLRELNLYGNLMDGSLPGSSLGMLKNIEILKLYANNFTGKIPTELGLLSELRHLDLDNNDLTGQIPNELGYLTKIDTLWLNGNQKNSGTIPEGIFANMTLLKRLYLGNMTLSGTLSESIGKLKELQYLQVRANKLTGTIPQSIGECLKMQVVEFDRNNFKGPLPESMSNMKAIRTIYLNDNGFNGYGIPRQWSKMTNLRTLVASQANLNGVFYTDFGKWSSLQHLLLDRNSFMGPLPTQIGDLSNLTHLYLYNNKFSGTIPSELGLATKLKEIVVDGNELVGSVPSELGQLEELKTIFLFENELTGEIPDSVCNLFEQHNLQNLWADCLSGLSCSCCTACCVFNSTYNGCYYV